MENSNDIDRNLSTAIHPGTMTNNSALMTSSTSPPLEESQSHSPDSGLPLSPSPYHFTRAIVATFIECYVDLQYVTRRSPSSRLANLQTQMNRFSAPSFLLEGQQEQPRRIYSTFNSVDDSVSTTLPSTAYSQQQAASAFSPVTPRHRPHQPVEPLLPVLTLVSEYRIAIRRLCSDLQEHHEDSLQVLQRYLEPLYGMHNVTGANGSTLDGTSHSWPPTCQHISHDSFTRILDHLFDRHISWGRIIMMLTFSSMLALRALQGLQNHNQAISLPYPQGAVSGSALLPPRDACIWQYVEWTTDYIHSNLWSWIQENGGWAGLLAYEEGRTSSRSLTSHILLAGGFLALGSLVAYFFTRSLH